MSFLEDYFLITIGKLYGTTKVWVTQRFSWISGVDRGRQRLRGTTTGAPSIRRYRSGERCCRRGGSTWRSTLPPVGGPSRWPARLRKGAQETAGTRGEATVPASSQGRSYVPRVRGRAQRFKTQEIRFRWRSKVKTYKTYFSGSVCTERFEDRSNNFCLDNKIDRLDALGSKVRWTVVCG